MATLIKYSQHTKSTGILSGNKTAGIVNLLLQGLAVHNLNGCAGLCWHWGWCQRDCLLPFSAIMHTKKKPKF